MFSESIIDNSRSIIDDSKVKLQLEASFTILIEDCQHFIVQVTCRNNEYTNKLEVLARDKHFN
jgi:hypothetical protein